MRYGLNVCQVYCPECYDQFECSIGVSPAAAFADWKELKRGKLVTCKRCATEFYAQPVTVTIEVPTYHGTVSSIDIVEAVRAAALGPTHE